MTIGDKQLVALEIAQDRHPKLNVLDGPGHIGNGDGVSNPELILDQNEKAIIVLEKTVKLKPSNSYFLEDQAELKLCKEFLKDLEK